MTPQQLQALKAAIDADPILSQEPLNSDGAFAIAIAMNAPANPAFVVWRTFVTRQEVMENGFLWTTVDGLSAGKARIWEWMTQSGSFNPSKTNVRQGISDAFGATMEAAIMPHLKRNASRVEKLFATGTGSTVSPATMVIEGPIPYQDVEAARNS